MVWAQDTLINESIRKNSDWFLTNLKEFDKKRPYLTITSVQKATIAICPKLRVFSPVKNNDGCLVITNSRQENLTVDLFSIKGVFLKTLFAGVGGASSLVIPLQNRALGCGTYVTRVTQGALISNKKVQIVR
jgi:hypothetical protein